MARGEVNVVNEKSLADYDFAPFRENRLQQKPHFRVCKTNITINGVANRPPW
jgi:hypothetical protein